MIAASQEFTVENFMNFKNPLPKSYYYNLFCTCRLASDRNVVASNLVLILNN